jgi:hypothetical protein
MRLKILTLVFAITLSACSFQVDIIETPTPALTVIAGASSTSTSIPTAENTATPLPEPTLSVTNTTLPASAITPQGSIFPVRFAPNGTYVDIIESIKAGGSKTYSVNAMKGQVMSASVHQNEESELTYISMRIVGADNSVLCDSCTFWRGVLPATQDYLVTLTPAADALDFMMRIAINPPGAATQSFLYENKYRNASLSYTDVFTPALFPGAIAYRIEPELALQFIDTQSYAHTNLNEAYLIFGSSTDPQVVAHCTEPVSQGGPETIVGNVTIHGVSFTKSESTGVGAGNVYEQTYYRAVQDGMCFEITYFIHYGNIGNYDPNAVTEFDRGTLLQRFDEVLSTFTLR